MAPSGARRGSALLLIFSFPNFEFYLLAWIALVPLLVVIARRPSPFTRSYSGWATGNVFFYATCYWLTYSMIHYGGLPTVLAYLLLIPGALVIGIFPGLFACAGGTRDSPVGPWRSARAGILGRARMGSSRRDGPALECSRLLTGLTNPYLDPGGDVGWCLRSQFSDRRDQLDRRSADNESDALRPSQRRC